jgi:hypothetical protein
MHHRRKDRNDSSPFTTLTAKDLLQMLNPGISSGLRWCGRLGDRRPPVLTPERSIVVAIVWTLASGGATSVSEIACMNSLTWEVAKCMSVELFGES